MKYNVYFDLEPIFIEGIEADSPEQAEGLALMHIMEQIEVHMCEVTECDEGE